MEFGLTLLIDLKFISTSIFHSTSTNMLEAVATPRQYTYYGYTLPDRYHQSSDTTIINSRSRSQSVLTDDEDFSGISFAVPSNMIFKEIPTIIKTGTYNHPWIGIVGAGLTC